MNTSELCEIPEEIGGQQNSKSGNSRLFRNTLDLFNNGQSGRKCVKGAKSIQSDVIETETVIKGFTLCDESIADYVRSMLIFHTAKEVSLNCETLSETVTEKLREHIMIHEIDRYMHLPPSAEHVHEELTVLGIMDLPKYEFCYAERRDIRCCVEALLRDKLNKFLNRFENSEKTTKDAMKINETKAHQKLFECHGQQLVEQKERIENLSIKFKNDILKCRDLVNLWRELKHDDTSEVYYRKASYLLIQSQVAEVQAKITKLSCLIRMFKETPITRNAFKRLNMSVDEKLFAVLKEIKQKETLKRGYECLRGTEYDKVVRNYLDLCRAVKRKQHILDRL